MNIWFCRSRTTRLWKIHSGYEKSTKSKIETWKISSNSMATFQTLHEKKFGELQIVNVPIMVKFSKQQKLLVCIFLAFGTWNNILTIIVQAHTLKFIYCEKATKFCEIFPLLLTALHTVKSKGKMSQNFVAFWEYLNFK